MRAKQNRCRSTRGPVQRGKDVPHGPTAEKHRPNMPSKHKLTCCACTQLTAGPGNLLTPALLITDRSKHDWHTCQTKAPIHYAPWQITKETRRTGSWLWHPPHPSGGSGGVLPCCAPHGPSTAKRLEGQSGLSRGALTHRKGAKEVLVGEGGRVPLLVPLTGRPQARPHRVKIMYPARRICWVTFRRNKKTRNGYPRPTTKPEGPQDTLLARAKNSTSLSLDLALCHRTVTAYTYPGPLHIYRQANSLHPAP